MNATDLSHRSRRIPAFSLFLGLLLCLFGRPTYGAGERPESKGDRASREIARPDQASRLEAVDSVRAQRLVIAALRQAGLAAGARDLSKSFSRSSSDVVAEVGSASAGGIIGPLCSQSGNCQARDATDALPSNRIESTVADDFRPDVSGDISEVCWWGTYVRDIDGTSVNCYDSNVVDTFEVTYCDDAGGFPGSNCTTFSKTQGSLTVTGPINTGDLIAGFFTEFAFNATHEPFAVTVGECYWIEISNDSGECSWFWEVSAEGDDWSMQDLGLPPDGYELADFILRDFAFCVDAQLSVDAPCGPPANAACPNESVDCCQKGPDCCEDEPDCPGVIDCEAGCDDERCCELVCACDPLCCDPINGWDNICAGTSEFSTSCSAAVLCARDCIPCGDPDSGDCCEDTDSPSCTDAACCEAVCAVDPFCCDSEWDSLCAQQAETICADLCGPPPPACLNPDAKSCCVLHPFEPGCSDEECCELVCACDLACCSEFGWDSFCATTGFENSGCGAELLCPDLCFCNSFCGDINGDEASVNGAGSNADLLDFALFANCFGQQPNNTKDCLCSDLDGSGEIDLCDYAILVALFETTSVNSPRDCASVCK